MSAKHGDVATGPGWDLRCGDYRDVFPECFEPDVLISDPPYSPRQGEGFRSHNDYARKNGARPAVPKYSGSICAFQGMPYAPMSAEFAEEMAARFAGVDWMVTFGDHVSFRWWEDAGNAADRYVFAPVVWLRGNAPRFQGDGPCSAAEYICVTRRRNTPKPGSLPGFYDHTPLKGDALQCRIVTGQKPLDLMRAVVRDYSKPGQVVLDPCAGGGTTLLAAVLEGRRAIGAELDPVTFEKAVKRLRSHAITPPLPGISEPVRMVQTGLDLEGGE